MLQRQKRRLSSFLEAHEKSFRTEIILIPVLVLSLKFFQEYIDNANTFLEISTIIGVALVCYFLGLLFVVIGGDILLRRLAFGLNPVYKFRGVYVQITGAEGREFAISRIYINFLKGEYVYRGIAFTEDLVQAAAWEATLSDSDVIDGDIVLFFSGRSTIRKELNRYEIPLFKNQVFSVLYFAGRNRFRGAGFDFKRSGVVDYRSSFPISGIRVDEGIIDARGISPRILLDSFSVSDHDRRVIKEFAKRDVKSI